MNNQRRKELYTIAQEIVKLLNNINPNFTRENIVCIIKDVIKELESVQWDEEYYMDNMPENLQNSYRYEVAEEACDNISLAIDCLETIIEYDEFSIDDVINILNKSIDYINNATA